LGPPQVLAGRRAARDHLVGAAFVLDLGETMIEWEDLDFITVLEVLSQTDQCGFTCDFVVKKDDLQLNVAVYSLEHDIRIELWMQGLKGPVVELALQRRATGLACGGPGG
jgi:hypothetical protein